MQGTSTAASSGRGSPRLLTAAASVLSGLALLLTACGEEGEGPAPALVCATPSQETGGDEGFRAFLPLVQLAVERGDTAFFASRAKTIDVVCTKEDIPTTVGGPVCDYVGQAYQGLGVGYWRAEGNILPVDDALDDLYRLLEDALDASSDELGGGSARICAVNVKAPQYSTILSAIVPARAPSPQNPDRESRRKLSLGWEFTEEGWMFDDVLHGGPCTEPDDVDRVGWPNWEPYQACVTPEAP